MLGQRYPTGRLVVAACVMGTVTSGYLASDALAEDTGTVFVQTQVLPYAELEFLNTATLAMTIPPAGSTEPSNSVFFRVIGNTLVAITAEPDAFVSIPGAGTIGQAVHDGRVIGYKIRVIFPTGGQGLPEDSEQLPGTGDGTAPLTADLSFISSLDGAVDLIANHEWTLDGELPLPGTYEGTVVLTLSTY
jgi:hypothetical protein